MRSAVVMLLGAISMCLGCVAEPSEGDHATGPSSHQGSDPYEAGGSPAGASSGGSGEMLVAAARRFHHDPGPEEAANISEQTGTASSACWWWGPTPTGLIAQVAEVAEHAVAQ
jgi:hypothetical protein